MTQTVIYVVLGFIAAAIIVRSIRLDTVWPGETGLLYQRGKFVRTLDPGPHCRFDPLRHARVERVPTVPQALTQQLVEVISKDQFAFRITLAPMATITEPRSYWEANRPANGADFALSMGMPLQFPRLSATLAASALTAVAAVTLEEFLADPAGSLAGIADDIGTALTGAKLDGILVTAITLPPETRKMFTEIERARREGFAALERARGEQASLRALANAARSLADNPELARLRMLQVMENARGSKTFVLGDAARTGLDQPDSD